MLALSISLADRADLNRAVNTTEIPQCSRLFATRSWCYGFGRAQEGTMLGIRRREFIAGLGGAAAWPLVARAQQGQRVPRIGLILSGLAPDDSEGQARITAFVQGLQELGWTDGRNMRIEYRWGLGDPERLRRYATELVGLRPDIILAGGGPAVEALQQASRTLPIVFANVADPVGAGYVASMARPGGNITGFMNNEFGLSAKWLELLKQIAPRVTRVAVLRVPNLAGSSQFAAIQAVAPSVGVELTPIDMRGDAVEIERALTPFLRGANNGLIMTGAGVSQTQRDTIIALASRHRLPAVYSFRRFAADGGLISFGTDQAEPYRLAAGYVDRVLKGEKPADLPVQAPTKYELVINLKTAKALGIEVPVTLRVRADEVIE
jgi:putative ABC transport system substrate-binding protein